MNSQHVVGRARIDLNKMSIFLNNKTKKINNSKEKF